MKTDVSGNLIWETTYGGGMVDLGFFVCNTSDGGYIICGYTESFGASYDVYVIKTAPDVGIKESEFSPEVCFDFKNKPNPFSTSTTITFTLPGAQEHKSTRAQVENIELKIYDMSGRLVKDFSLSTNNSSPGTAVSWDGRDFKDKKVPPGIYFAKLSSGDFTSVKKIILVK